jgi:hypothetical protein
MDIAENFSSGPGLVIRQVVFFALAVWAGCILAGASLTVGEMIDDWRLRVKLAKILGTPALLLSALLVPNLVFLGINFCRLLIYPESTGIRTWVSIVVVEALFAMVEASGNGWRNPWALLAAWAAWLLFIGMACVGFWFLHQWQINRWAIQLEELKTENAIRRMEAEQDLDNDSSSWDET